MNDGRDIEHDMACEALTMMEGTFNKARECLAGTMVSYVQRRTACNNVREPISLSPQTPLSCCHAL